VLPSSNNLAAISSDFTLVGNQTHLGDYDGLPVTGNVATVVQQWISTNLDMGLGIGICTFKTSANLADQLNKEREVSNMMPRSSPVTTNELKGRNYKIDVTIRYLHPTIDTNTRPYRSDIQKKITDIIEDRIQRAKWRLE
ncbi:MAG: hypothetical protein KKD33_09885, partial [Verrucomicrobia bacterium]|nr:hypothetical protein [Verrucomicrobiota bacterium]